MRFVIMAGGSGTRFWPLSRRISPKQYLEITGAAPMIVETVERVRPSAGPGGIMLVINALHLELTRSLFPQGGVSILTEPRGRNTAACIGLACLHLVRDGVEPAAFLPADHAVGDADAFRALVEQGAALAADGGIVTLGIVPTRPETGYGYIRRGEALSGSPGPSAHGASAQGAGAHGASAQGASAHGAGIEAYRVKEFVEKPDLERARAYMESGEYYWNAGMFIARPDVLLSEIETLLPELHEGLALIAPGIGGPSYDDALGSAYDRIPAVSIDYGVMEKTSRPVYVLPVRFGWTDVGSWQALYEHRGAEHDADRNLVDGRGVLVDTLRSFVVARGGRLVSCVGLRDCLVVDTPDALLVADLSSSQSVRNVLQRLDALGLKDVL